jgi:hypothetical protein
MKPLEQIIQQWQAKASNDKSNQHIENKQVREYLPYLRASHDSAQVGRRGARIDWLLGYHVSALDGPGKETASGEKKKAAIRKRSHEPYPCHWVSVHPHPGSLPPAAATSLSPPRPQPHGSFPSQQRRPLPATRLRVAQTPALSRARDSQLWCLRWLLWRRPRKSWGCGDSLVVDLQKRETREALTRATHQKPLQGQLSMCGDALSPPQIFSCFSGIPRMNRIWRI